ncbi:MAG: hypothetical protein IH596_15355 [Bacteroidales bacterium]|nr:hypothetical protein [Bacteroidales bacterium]
MLDPSVNESAIGYGHPVKYRMVLQLYYNCMQKDFFPSQTITAHESVALSQTALVNLTLDSVSTTNQMLTAGCAGVTEQCLKTATYSGEIVLQNMFGGYDITWGYCCWNMSVLNIDNLHPQGIALVLHVPFVDNSAPNSSPSFMESPVVLACADKILNINSAAMDSDGDQLTYQLIHPNTYEQEDFPGNVIHPEIFPAQEVFQPMTVGRPPFKKIVYNKGFSFKNPLGKANFSINNETGSIDTKPLAAGQYLVGIGVSETRNGKKLGETQRIFLLQIISDPK